MIPENWAEKPPPPPAAKQGKFWDDLSISCNFLQLWFRWQVLNRWDLFPTRNSTRNERPHAGYDNPLAKFLLSSLQRPTYVRYLNKSSLCLNDTHQKLLLFCIYNFLSIWLSNVMSKVHVWDGQRLTATMTRTSCNVNFFYNLPVFKRITYADAIDLYRSCPAVSQICTFISFPSRWTHLQVDIWLVIHVGIICLFTLMTDTNCLLNYLSLLWNFLRKKYKEGNTQRRENTVKPAQF